MANSLFPFTRQQFFGNTGLPLAYGYVYTYAAGTTTPQTTYNATGGVNSNPIELDFRGQCDIWGPSNSGYKILVTDSSGNTIPGYPVDNITVGPTTSGSFTASGSGFSGTAPTTTVNWSVSGQQATVSFGPFTGTSNATTFGLSGIPSNLQPPTLTQVLPLVVAQNNGTTLYTGIAIEFLAGNSNWPFLYDASSTGWTSSGTKSVGAGTFNHTLSYLLV